MMEVEGTMRICSLGRSGNPCWRNAMWEARLMMQAVEPVVMKSCMEEMSW